VNQTLKECSLFLSLMMIVFLVGCNGTFAGAHKDANYLVPAEEASWIRDGDPIVFENESWYPKDDIDVLVDDEVYFLGEYNGVQFFVEKMDVRPYNRLYTKFAQNRFRAFAKQRHD